MQEKTARRDSLALLSERTPWAPAPVSKAGLTPCVLGTLRSDVGLWKMKAPETEIPVLGPHEPAGCREHREGVKSPGSRCKLAHHLLGSLGLVVSFIK